MTQQDLATAIGLSSPSIVSHWEGGKSSPEKYLMALISELRVTAEELLYDRRTPTLVEGDSMRKELLRKIFATEPGSELKPHQRIALSVLLEGIDPEEWAVRAALELFLRSKPQQPKE